MKERKLGGAGGGGVHNGKHEVVGNRRSFVRENLCLEEQFLN